MTLFAWMLYATLISVLFGIAAICAEHAARRLAGPSRLPWAGALLASSLLPWLPVRSTSGPPPPGGLGGGAVGVVEVVEIVSRGQPLLGPTYLTLDRILLVVWVGASLTLAAWVLLGTVATRRRVADWDVHCVAGQRVFVSRAVGPAVTGFVGGRIVVPEWLLGWEEELQRMVVGHEREHLRARDPGLRLFGIAACIAAPWNPALWWQRRRLELAIECDCDARVLREYPDRKRYGDLLLRVVRASRSSRPGPFRSPRSGAPAFSPPASTLEARVARVLDRSAEKGRKSALLPVLASAGLVLGAFSCAGPAAPDAGYLKILVASDAMAPVFADDGFLVLWGTPPEDRLEAELARHHPEVLRAGLPQGEAVWFIVDEELRIRRTGVGPREGLEARLRAEHPTETSGFQLGFEVPRGSEARRGSIAAGQENPPTVEVLWMVPEPPPGTTPWWRP